MRQLRWRHREVLWARFTEDQRNICRGHKIKSPEVMVIIIRISSVDLVQHCHNFQGNRMASHNSANSRLNKLLSYKLKELSITNLQRDSLPSANQFNWITFSKKVAPNSTLWVSPPGHIFANPVVNQGALSTLIEVTKLDLLLLKPKGFLISTQQRQSATSRNHLLSIWALLVERKSLKRQ